MGTRQKKHNFFNDLECFLRYDINREKEYLDVGQILDDIKRFFVKHKSYKITYQEKKSKKNNNRYEDRVMKIQPTTRMKSEKQCFVMTEQESMKADEDRNKRLRKSNA